mmetsp:Transcript_32506/g.24018  ORF Transcript_32506/g.24018 Transcript_32506/m.24018 type:complete len:122 (-) Transcript_32506:172-537(-)
MSCRWQDDNSGFIASYQYCSASDVCLKNAWNYINYDCESKWVKGKKLDLDADCDAKISDECMTFTSTEANFGIYTNYTFTLYEKEMCDIVVDAKKAVARVIFDDTVDLGIVDDIENNYGVS